MSSAPPSPGPTAITLDQLIAINDEIVALTRCGVPLEKGLSDLGRDLPGRLGRISESYAHRLQQGESLADVLGDHQGDLPPIYSAVVQAGIRSGRLAVALEGLATSSRRVAELRKMVALALVYPLLVLTVACVLFAVVVPALLDRLVWTYDSFEVPAGHVLRLAAVWTDYFSGAVLAIPVVALFLAITWWWRSRRAATAATARFGAMTSLLPQVGKMLRVGRTAAFLEILALLVEQRVPLPESLRLAGTASGDAALLAAATHLAEMVERGESPAEPPPGRPAIPPLVRWRLLQPGTEEHLRNSLRHAADTYRRRTKQLTDWLTIYLPLVLTVLIGGTALVVYTLFTLVPWYRFLLDLSRIV